MSGEIINLRRARKQKARADKEQRAAENRRRFGLSKAERKHEAAERERAARHIDGHRSDDDVKS